LITSSASGEIGQFFAMVISQKLKKAKRYLKRLENVFIRSR